MYVILTEGSVFEYNKTVNMTGKSAQDLLFNAYILPSVAYNKATGAIGERNRERGSFEHPSEYIS